MKILIKHEKNIRGERLSTGDFIKLAQIISKVKNNEV